MLIGNQIPTRPQPRKARALLQVQRSEITWIWQCQGTCEKPTRHHDPRGSWKRGKVCGATRRSQQSTMLVGAVAALVVHFCAGGSGTGMMPGWIAPSASLFFRTEEADSKDIRERLRLLEREAMKERIQGKEKIFPLLFSLSDLLGVRYLHAIHTI